VAREEGDVSSYYVSLVNTQGAAEMLGSTPKYVRTLVARGKLRPLPGDRARGGHLFAAADVAALRDATAGAHPWAGKAVPTKRPKGVQ